MTLKKIGIPISKLGENSVGLTLSYLEYASQFGEPILLLPNSSFRPDLDLLLLTGGADIAVDRYSEFPSYFTGKPDIHKEYFDLNILPAYIESQIPILAICRGHQSIAVHFGSKLIQHMSHETNKPEDPYKTMHNIKINAIDFWNFSEFAPVLQNRQPQRVYGVNSRHHQAIDPRFLGEGLSVLATHEKDNAIELMAHNTLPIIGCQFHAEDLMDYDTIVLMENMINRIMRTKKSVLQDE
jgi:putative glutamine amidotransferase